jgi:hypothetical protein
MQTAKKSRLNLAIKQSADYGLLALFVRHDLSQFSIGKECVLLSQNSFQQFTTNRIICFFSRDSPDAT